VFVAMSVVFGVGVGMKRALIASVLSLGLVAFAGVAGAAEPAKPQVPNDPRAAIAAKLPGVKASDVKPSPVSGFYEVIVEGEYLLSGDLFEISSRVNLTEAARSATRHQALAALNEDQMIIFSPPVVKHTITVFTDVDCAYCRKLHGEIAQLNKLGIRVRYLAYPRSGPGSEDWHKMEAVWCSKDRKAAITEAKLGNEIEKAPKCKTPIASQYALGESFGVRGTPAIITDEGQYIGGYLPPQKLAAVLDGALTRADARPLPQGER
jgi:thiol:disulfide interchange protein DsbC